MSLVPNGGFNSPLKRHLQDDDNTFLPPPLSAYAIALLNGSTESSTNTKEDVNAEITSENEHSLRESLKNKLAVHFKDSSPRIDSRHNSGTQNTSGFNSSFHNTSFHNLSGHSTSASNTSGNTLSHHNSTIHTGHSFDRTQNENEDAMALANESMAKSLLHPSVPVIMNETSTSSRIHSASTTSHRRSRFARRFTHLGPPKRASDISVSSEVDSNGAFSTVHSDSKRQHSDLSSPKSKIDFEMSQYLLDTPQRPLSKDSIKRTVSGESNFFKSLEKLKKNSTNNDPFPSPMTERKLHRSPVLSNTPKHDMESKNPIHKASFQVFSDQKPSNLSFMRPPSQLQSARYPLSSVSPNKFRTDGDKDGFRKPKIPKLAGIHPQTPPQSLKPQHQISSYPSNPSPAVILHADHSTVKSFDPESSNRGSNDSKRRKLIYVNNSQYEKLELLGRGGSSKVYKARSLSNKRVVAIKKVSFDQFDDACVQGFKGEIELLNKLRDEPRVVKLFEHAISDGSIYLAMECGELDMAHVLQTKNSNGSALDLNFVRFHAMEIFKCVEAVHRAGIVHSDLKPANFLFVKGMLKIIDFGIANAVPDHTANIYRESQIGTPNYMAPEALVEVNNTLTLSRAQNGNTWRMGKPSDIWSCGCIVYQMIYGRPPYASYAGQLRIMAIMNPQVKVRYPTHGLGDVAVPLSAIELMQRCLARSPFDRWTVEQCLASDFLKPKAVSNQFIKNVVRSAVDYGYNQRHREKILDETYDELVGSIIEQIENLNYA